MIRALVGAVGLGALFAAFWLVRRFVEARRRGTFQYGGTDPPEHRNIYVFWLLHCGVGAMVLTLAAIECLVYAVAGIHLGLGEIGGRPLGDP